MRNFHVATAAVWHTRVHTGFAAGYWLAGVSAPGALCAELAKNIRCVVDDFGDLVEVPR